MAKGKGEEFVTVNFNLKKEYHDRLALLCSHRGDKGWYLNQAVDDGYPWKRRRWQRLINVSRSSIMTCRILMYQESRVSII